MKTKQTLALAAGALIAFNGARAQNLLVNGGFEERRPSRPTAGGLYGWTHTGNVSVHRSYELNGQAATLVTPDSSVPGNRHFAVMSGANGSGDSALTQNPALPGSFHLPVILSFEYDLLAEDTAANQNREQQGSTLSLSIGGDTVFSQTYDGPTLNAQGEAGQTGWQDITLHLTSAEVADIEANGLEFTFDVDQSDSHGFDFAAAIDNVSLSVPDSGSTLLFLGALAPALAFVKRKLS